MSSGLFMCYREIIPSTSVAAASFFEIKNPITNNPDEYLIIATTSNVSVYKIIQHENRFLSKLVYTTSIFGKVRDIQVIHSQIFGYATEDQIIMSFDDGKFVIVEYDCIKGEFIVDSMYNAEEGAIGRGAEIHVEPQERLSFPGIGRIPIMSVDSVGSVVCSVLYGFRLFLIPLHSTVYNVMQTKPPKPFIFELKSLGLLGPILDILFVSGYSRPVLAVLHEPRPLPIGHTSKIRNSCCLSVLAVDVALSKLVVLWQQDNLPHDCYRLSPLLHHSIPGGVIVTSTNALLIACQDAIVGLAMNGFAGIIPTDNIRLQPSSTLPIGVELDASNIVEAGHNCVVISLKDGQLLQVKFVVPMESPWTGLKFEPEIIANSIRARCFCVSESMGLWFLGSAFSDSLIMSVTYAENNANGLTASGIATVPSGPGGTGGGGTGTPATKRLRRVTRPSTPNPEAQLQLQIQQHQQQQQQLLIKFSEEIDKEETALYGTPLRSTSMTARGTHTISSHLHVTVIDTIPVLGPVIDGLFGTADESLGVDDRITWTKSDRLPPPWTPPAAGYIADKDAKDWLQLNVGLGDAASLCRISLGLRLAKLSSLDLSGITFFTSLVLTSTTLIFLTQNNSTKILEMKENSEDLHMVEFQASEKGFVENTTTITVAFILNNILLQVFTSGLRMIRVESEGGEYSALQDILVEEEIDLGGLGGESGEIIISANICNGWVVVMTSLKSVYLLEVQVEGEDTDLLLRYKLGHQLEINETSSILTDLLSSVEAASFFYGSLKVSDTILLSSGSSEAAAVTRANRKGSSSTEDSEILSKKIAAEESYFYQDTDTSTLTNESIDADSTTTSSNIQLVSILQENKRKRDNDENNENNNESTSEDPESNSSNDNNTTDMIVSEGAINNASTESHQDEEQKQVQEKQPEEILHDNADKRGEMDVALSNDSNEATTNIYTNDATNATTTANNDDSNDSSNDKQLHLLLSTSNGSILCIRLTDLKLIFQLSNILLFPSILPIDTTGSDSNSNGISSDKNYTYTNQASDKSPPNERQILNTKLCRISSGDLPEAEAAVVLVIIAENEDIYLYSGIECNGYLTSFHKIDHNTVTRRKKPSQSLLKQSWIDSGCSIQLQQLMLSAIVDVTDIDGRSGILLSGTRPQFVFADQGHPTMMSLGFPELPYSSETGAYCIGTLRCGDVRGVISLWSDVSDIYPGTRLSSLGLYKEVPNLKTFPTAGVSLRQSMVGCTVHKCVEVLPRTEDRTQLALLSRRTFIMLCSEESMIRIPKQMLTEKDKEVDRATYERFFPEMEGYYALDDNLGAAPLVPQRLYKLILVQNSIVVDTYQLSEGEVVLDVDAVYFSSEIDAESETSPDSKEEAASSSDMNPMDSSEKTKTIKKSICIAASTSRCDRHGEDSQGEGRLLLFSLDFALYQGDQEDTTTAITETTTAESKNSNETTTTTASESMDAATTTSTPSTSTPPPPASAATSTAQSQFLKAIQPKLNLLWTGPGPAMVVKQFGEYLLSTVGQTVFIYRLDAALMELEQIAQFYAQFYIVKVSIIKNYIMLADACKSIQFLVWRASDNSLTLLSKDFYNCFCMCADYLLDNSTLGMVLGDDEGNIRLLQYNPRVLESRKGFQLLCLAEMHLGSVPTMLLPHRVLVDPVAAPLPPATPTSTQILNNMNRLLQYRKLQRERSITGMTTTRPYGGRLDKNTSKKSTLVIGTVDGSLGLLVAVEEKTYRRLALLQQIMSTSIKTSFGLNPREFRIVKTEKFRLEKKRGVLDGNLLWKFINLEPSLQDELTAAMGTTVDKVLENLLEIDVLNSFF